MIIMMGVMQVVQRINTIENRFRQQPTAIMPQINTGQSFSETLAEAQKRDDNHQLPNSVANNGNISSTSISKNKIAQTVQNTALKYGVNPNLALAVANAESNLNQEAISPVGAVGVMQLMPDTARALGVEDINNLSQNIDGGVRYLKQMLDTFGGDVNKAVAAYNAGPGAVKKYNDIPPYRETQQYVARVNSYMR